MRAMRGFTRLFVVAVTAMTLLLLAAVGAAAGSGSLGSGKAVKAVVSLVAPSFGSEKTNTQTEANGNKTEGDNNGNHTGQCHPPKKEHKHGTPGHKNHPCGEDGDDSD